MAPKGSRAIKEETLDQANKREQIVAGSKLSVSYLIMNGLATAVASYGLLADSTAVVIGAMIIAMLLGPIMGLALALVDGDVKLLTDSVIAEVVGVIMVVSIAAIIGKIHFDLQITNEILSRTKPNLLDLAIALFGGAAGAYAAVSPKVSVGLVGVAISTALVPPLASCGICLTRGLYPQALGAFVLFATNLVAIQCASSLVLYIAGFHRITVRKKDDPGYIRRLIIDIVALLALTIFLYIQLKNTVVQDQFRREIKSKLEIGIKPIPGAFLSEVRHVEQKDRLVIIAYVRTPNSITPAQTAELQETLGDYNGLPIQLRVQSVLTKETTAEGYLHVIEPTNSGSDVTNQDAPLQSPTIIDEPIPDSPNN